MGRDDNSTVWAKFYVVVVVLLFFFCIVAGAEFLYFSSMLNSSKEQVARLQAGISNLNEMLSAKDFEKLTLQAKLDNANRLLGEKGKALEDVSAENASCVSDYGRLKSEIDATIQGFDGREKTIEDRISWFQQNASLPQNTDPGVVWKVDKMCTTVENNSCTFNFGCLYYLNSSFLKVYYKADKANGRLSDTLISIADFLQSRAGDCEDFSFLFKAEFNKMLDVCSAGAADFNSASMKIISYTTSADYPGQLGNLYVDKEKDVALMGVKTVELSGFRYPVVVCGNLYNPNTKSFGGHCMNAFTKNKITGVENLYSELSGAPLIEPQGGYFGGYLNGGSGVWVYDNGEVRDENNYVYMVITDDDLFLDDYIKDVASWSGYNGFVEKMKSIKEKLSGLKVRDSNIGLKAQKE